MTLNLPDGCFRTHYDPNHHVDAGRIIAWLDNPNRKPANTAFTAGLERDIAYRVELLLLSHKHSEGTVDLKKHESWCGLRANHGGECVAVMSRDLSTQKSDYDLTDEKGRPLTYWGGLKDDPTKP